MHADVDSKIRLFRGTKTEWGFERFMPLKTLTNPSKGYIHNDACTFGAEVFVIKQSGLKEDVNPYTWKVENFSTIKDKEYHCSTTFLVRGYAWYFMHSAYASVLFFFFQKKKEKTKLPDKNKKPQV